MIAKIRHNLLSIGDPLVSRAAVREPMKAIQMARVYSPQPVIDRRSFGF
jgi:hypothetical protein